MPLISLSQKGREREKKKDVKRKESVTQAQKAIDPHCYVPG